MTGPAPRPTPGPPPVPPPEDNSQAVNGKKMALEYVVGSINKAVREIGADSAETGTTPPSESLTNGLGGDGSVWKSSLADNMHTKLAVLLRSISSYFSSEEEKITSEWHNEPQYVDKTDSRARWGAR